MALQLGHRLTVLVAASKEPRLRSTHRRQVLRDLALFPNVVDELREVPIGGLIPAGYGPRPPTPRVFESGGTTGAPKRVIIMPDWGRQTVEWEVGELQGDPRVRDGGFLLVSATGPHAVGHVQERLAEALNSAFFTVDLDPRWVKKLIARGAADEAAVYVDHVVEQAGYILRSQHITLLMTTPPLLQAIVRHDDLVEAIDEKVVWLKLGGAHLDEDTRQILHEIFPNTRLLNVYGSTMVVGQAHTRVADSLDDPTVHDGRTPYLTFSVIDPDTDRAVRCGERGQVVMHHVSKSLFVPNNLERDTAIRVPAADGQIRNALTETVPVQTFGGEAVIEGVY